MSWIQRVGDLELDQNLRVERISWAVERVGWAVMAVVVIAAVLGLFGAGIFAEIRESAPDGSLAVMHRRFDRLAATTEVRLHVEPALVRDGAVRLWVGQALLESYQVEQVTPQPDRVELAAGAGPADDPRSGRLVYQFNTGPSPGVMTITLHLRPQHVGAQSGEVGAVGGPSLPVRQFIYP